MSSQSMAGSPLAKPTPQARTSTVQGLVNRLVRGVLRTPLLCRLAGSRLVTLYVVGRKSGRRYTIPVAYTRHEGYLLIGTSSGWGRNLRSGQPVEIRLAGRLRPADVQVLTSEQEVTGAYAVICRDNHNFARFNSIGLDAAGQPKTADLHRAWQAGARAFRLTPR